MIESVSIEFKKLNIDDIGLLIDWRKQPHVAEFFDRGETESQLREKYQERISSDVVHPYLILFDETPAGYIQYYWAAKCGDGWWPDMEDDVVGFDMFIGDANFVGKGLGKKTIMQFKEFLFQIHGVNKVIVDPSPKNTRMIHCLEACGFKNEGVVDTPDGEEVLLTFRR